MATSNKTSSTSQDVSTDTDDSDCAKDGSDSNNNNEISSSIKHRGIKRVHNKMKPCLVHKTSTSDEELQSNETNPIISTHTGPTHGILKVPSGSTSPELHVPNLPIKPLKIKNKSKSVSPTPANDNSSIIIGAPTEQQHRNRPKISDNTNKKKFTNKQLFQQL